MINAMWLFLIVPSSALFGFALAACCVAAGRADDVR